MPLWIGDTSNWNLYFSTATIKKICKKIVDAGNSAEQDANFDPLQELVRYFFYRKIIQRDWNFLLKFLFLWRYVQYANDELDYGMGLELGLDLLAYGGEVFHSTILHLLGVAYELLDRPEFFTVLKVNYFNGTWILRMNFVFNSSMPIFGF